MPCYKSPSILNPDPYNEQHFLQHPVTDFYDRHDFKGDNCDLMGQDKMDSAVEKIEEDFLQATIAGLDSGFLQPQSGDDWAVPVVIVEQATSTSGQQQPPRPRPRPQPTAVSGSISTFLP